MEIAREEARAQRQMMNVMMMAMLNKNGRQQQPTT
jgi:hypothetical protein